VLGNSKNKRFLPVLSRAAERDPSEVVRQTAREAHERLRTSGRDDAAAE
jgi:hypothetical protein